ncbi:TadE/TadG family type IV pilus assembly protein [Aurantiacibacter luteus]|uniref:TadE-like domain-containing protein n=1 Tax=Aurantiacibacter luteus TaxID=1581420 RepID=A0A0G9MXR0_9SPHN|nr:TadE/TadG family type IV pilus assembly protein [Aurantiacibacter luteus]KLE35485.1 hypothetical protein AAW00_03405 [Aurantiacibacter luteus]
MIGARALIARVRGDEHGSMAIETAFVAPVLLVMALGGFEVSTMVARQTELQSAAAEAAQVVRASAPETAAQRQTIHDILVVSSRLEDDQVSITPLYRCGTSEDYVTVAGSCGSDVEYQFIRIDLEDTYEPIWTSFGVSEGFDYNISRTVQVGSQA